MARVITKIPATINRYSSAPINVQVKRKVGYDKGPDGKLVINPEQAETVRLIFRMFLEGMTPHSISVYLTEHGIKTPGGKDKWDQTTVRRMLSNEKYKGDALLQKQYTVDYLTKKVKKNEGEVPMYYIEGDHEAIIDPDVFEMVQQEFARRKSGGSRYSGINEFSSKIKCGQCGSWFGAKVWHSTEEKYRKVIYRCNHKYKNVKCTTPHIMEDEIKGVFLNALNKLLKNKDEIVSNVKTICDVLCDTSELEAERQRYSDEMTEIAEAVEKAMIENSRIALDQEEYRRKNDELALKFDNAKMKYEELECKITDINNRSTNLRHFQETVESLKGQITEFDSVLWGSLVDYIVINEEGRKIVTFRDGTQI